MGRPREIEQEEQEAEEEEPSEGLGMRELEGLRE